MSKLEAGIKEPSPPPPVIVPDLSGKFLPGIPTNVTAENTNEDSGEE